MAHRWAKHELAAHAATLRDLDEALQQTAQGSVEAIFIGHSMNHCLEAWLSEFYGHEVRITALSLDGALVEHLV